VSNHATAAALPRNAATARKANLATERLIAALTLRLEGEVIDRLFVETVTLDDALATASAHDTPVLTGYRRHVARHIATAIANKASAMTWVNR
jgi:hypothetical protein